MATADEIKAQQEGIQNSEKLLDLSNQINNSISERRKLLKNLTAEEQQYFATVKQQQRLSQDIAANAEKYLGYQIKSKDLAKQKLAVEDNLKKSTLAFQNISNKLSADQQKAAKEARRLRTQERDLAKQILAIDENSQELELRKQAALRNNDLPEAQRLQRDIKANQLNATALEKRSKRLEDEIVKQKNIAKATAEIIKNAKESEEAQKKELAFLEENLRIRKQVEKSTGLLGGITKSLSKIPGIGQYLNADEANAEMEKLAAKMEEEGKSATSFGNRLQIGLKGASVLAKGLYENLKSPEAVFTFFFTQAFKANKQVVELGKSLGYGVGRADAFRERIADIARFSTNLNVTTENLVQSFNELVKATGFAYEFNADQLITQTKLTKQVGLQADEAAQIQRFSVLTGKSSEATYSAFVRGLVAARNQLRVGIDFKATLAEAAKVSGQLAANLGFNPETIAKAVVQAKAFGMTLEQVAAAGDKLLDFGNSITNELKAELLLGRSINLERARAAALAGDQVTLTEELAKNIGTAAEFTKLNRLQQNALAESVGMTTDALAETLRKREEALASGKSLVQVQEEEAKQALERQNIQDRFNQAILKLQDLVGNLVAGPLGRFVELISDILGNTFVFNTLIGGVLFTNMVKLVRMARALKVEELGIAVGKAWAAAFSGPQSLLTGGAAGLAIGAGLTAAILAAINSTKSIDDGIIGANGKILYTGAEGAIRLNDNDKIIAGTNLGGGGMDISPMIAAINTVNSSIENLASRPAVAYIQGKNAFAKDVATTAVKGTYKSA